MRKTLLAVATAALALPGCVFAYSEADDEWHSQGFISSDCCDDCMQMAVTERKLTEMEHHLAGKCEADCPYCKAAASAK